MRLTGLSSRLWRIAAGACLAATALYAHAPSIGLSRLYVTPVATPGGPNPAPEKVVMTNLTHGPMLWRASVATVTGAGWLDVTPKSGKLPGNTPGETVTFTITANSSQLAAGPYFGTITIEAPGDADGPPADNTPQFIYVSLTISSSGQPAPVIALSPASLAMEGVRGSGRVYTLGMRVSNAGGGTLNWTAQADAAWLSVSPSGGTGNSPLFVSASVGNLAAGLYNGRITVSAPGAANTASLPVTFRIRDPLPPTLQVSNQQIGFSTMRDAGNPPAQDLGVFNAGEAPLNWTVRANTFTGGAWLTVSPGSGTDNGSIRITADTSELAAGAYTGRLIITAEGAVNSPVQVSVSLTIRRPTPVLQPAGVVNAASFVSGPVAPGEILSIFGQRLGPAEPVSFTLDPVTGKLPETLAGVRVTFDDAPAPLYFVSSGQVNLQVPFEVAGKPSVRMVVSVPDLDHAELTLPVSEAAPGFFTFDGRRAAALNQDNSANSPDSPAAPGSVLQLFLTGQGQVQPRHATGAPAPSAPPFPEPLLPVRVNIDALPARVLFAGLAPGFVGLAQINAEIPRAVLPSNNVPVSVAVGDYQSSRVVTIAVR